MPGVHIPCLSVCLWSVTAAELPCSRALLSLNVAQAAALRSSTLQVGNAVPPPLAEALGRELARALAAAEQRLRQQPRR